MQRSEHKSLCELIPRHKVPREASGESEKLFFLFICSPVAQSVEHLPPMLHRKTTHGGSAMNSFKLGLGATMVTHAGVAQW